MNEKLERIKEVVKAEVKLAMTKNSILLPFIAPCYVAWFVWNYIGTYLSYSLGLLVRSKEAEREVWKKGMMVEIGEANSKSRFAMYAAIMSAIYMLVVGFNTDKPPTNLQAINMPTYFFLKAPVVAIEEIMKIEL